MNLKKLYPSLYILLERGIINKRYLASVLYKEEWERKNSNHSALTQRINNKLDGKSSFSDEELKLIVATLSNLSKEISGTIELVKKDIQKKTKIKNLVETISDEMLDKLTNESLVISWWSAGITSCISTYLALKQYKNVKIYYIDVGGEHPDNIRFLKDCEKWYGQKIEILTNSKGYKDHFDVFEKTRFLRGKDGNARCTVELKKEPRFELQKKLNGQWLHQVFGYDADELERAKRFSLEYPDARAIYPLIENNLNKDQCAGILQKAGIKLPEAYKHLPHNNCLGCVKSSSKGYWLQIKEHYPEQFKKMAKLERKFNFSLIKDIFLDELKTGGRPVKIVAPQCGLTCDVDD